MLFLGHRMFISHTDNIRLALACETQIESLNTLSEQLIEKGATVNLFEFALGKEENIKDVVEGVISQYDTLDALVLALEEPYHGDVDVKDPSNLIEASLDANYFTHVYFTYFALPHLRKARGRVILLSSFKEEGEDQKDALYYATRGATLGKLCADNEIFILTCMLQHFLKLYKKKSLVLML